VINAAVPSSMTKDFLLIHSHTAVGHSKAVLSVFATESTLYSSSKGICLIKSYTVGSGSLTPSERRRATLDIFVTARGSEIEITNLFCLVSCIKCI